MSISKIKSPTSFIHFSLALLIAFAFLLLPFSAQPAYAGQSSTVVYCTNDLPVRYLDPDSRTDTSRDEFGCAVPDDFGGDPILTGDIIVGEFTGPTLTNPTRYIYAECPGNTVPDIFRRQATGSDRLILQVQCDSGTDATTESFSNPSSRPSWWDTSNPTTPTGDAEDDEIPDCPNGAAGRAQALRGDCVDLFTRCPNGDYGITDQNGDCQPFNPDADDTNLADNPILLFLGRMITFLSAGVGFILVAITVVAGIRYSLARGNPQETAAAKSMIEKVAISAILYLFAFAIINWLVPGGLL